MSYKKLYAKGQTRHGSLPKSNLERIERLYQASVEAYPDITASKGCEDNSDRTVSDALFNCLVTAERTDINRNFLNHASRHFYLSDMLAGRSSGRADVISTLAAHIPGIVFPDGTAVPSGPVNSKSAAKPHVAAYLKSLDDEDSWKKALLVARTAPALNQFPFSVARTQAVAKAAVQMKERGYRLTVDGGQITMKDREVRRVVARIEEYLASLGAEFALKEIFALAARSYISDFGQILFGHTHGLGLGVRDPLLPIGLLFNIAVKLPFSPRRIVTDRAAMWHEALDLARDFAALLDLETYTQFDNLGIDATSLEHRLRKATLYNHVFGLRQWRYEFTAEQLTIFFGSAYNADLKAKFGWDIDDLVTLLVIVDPMTNTAPVKRARDLLYKKGLSYAVVSALLNDLAHCEGAVNRDYGSPFDAEAYTVLSKPFFSLHDSSGLAIFYPPRGLVGPAAFEAAFDAVKTLVDADHLQDLRGRGTERLTKHVFAKRGFHPTIEQREYNMGKGAGGECDFVFEDEDNILLVECKAKALTRGAMAGTQADALLDFAGGIVASQAQSLRHERLLRTRGAITFSDRTRLDFRHRRVTRLSISLTDQGALQDRWLLEACYDALLTGSVSCPPNYKKKSQVEKFNRVLQKLQVEATLLVEAGHDVRAPRLNIGSASLAQLDVMLEGATSLTEIRETLAIPASFNTGNPLLEHHHLSRIRGGG